MGIADKIDAALDIEEQKQTLIDKANNVIDSNVGTIVLGEDFNVEVLSGFLKQRFTMQSIGEDPNEDFDTGHDTKHMTGMDPEDFNNLIKAQSVIAGQVEILRRAVNEETRKPLFSDREISDAIWEPLKRRGIIAENAIPDRYSEVSTTFEGASLEYETRLAAFTDGQGPFDKLIDKLGIGKDFFDAGSALAGSVLGDLTALQSPLINNPSEVTSILKGITTGTDTFFDVTTTMLKEKDNLKDPKVIATICKSVVKGAQGIIGAGFSGSSSQEQALGKCISTGIGLAMNATAIAQKVKEGNYIDIADDIGDMISASFSMYSSDIKFDGNKDQGMGGSGGPTFAEFGDELKKGIAVAKSLLKALKDPTPEQFLNTMLDVMNAFADAGSTFYQDHVVKPGIEAQGDKVDQQRVKDANPNDTKAQLTKDTTNYEATAPSETGYAKNVIEGEWGALRDGVPGAFGGADKKIALMMRSSPDEIEEMIKKDPQLKAMGELIKKQNKIVQDEALKTRDQEMAEDDKNFRDMLNRSETAEDEGDIEQIESLIMQMKKDQAMVDLAFQMAGMGPQVVAAFLPQAGIAVSAINLVNNMRKAAQHFIAFQEWQDNVADARSAMTVQVEAMTNRMDLSRGKTTEYVVKSLENAMQLVAQAVSVAGPFAAAGHVASSTLSGVIAIKELIVKYYRRAKLEQAWKIYVAARTNPDDRKVVRESMRKNPTFAKYVIAYGAEYAGNPIARNAMKKCGLSEEVLDSKAANIQKVVTFLEAAYPEDPVLLKTVDRPEDWYPGPVLFDGLSFASFVGAAESKAKPALVSGSCRKLTTEFCTWGEMHSAYKTAYTVWTTADDAAAADNATQKEIQDAKDALHDLQRKLEQADGMLGSMMADVKSFRPATDTGEAHKGMSTYLGMLLPIGRQLRAKYQRETDVLAAQDDALPRTEDIG